MAAVVTARMAVEHGHRRRSQINLNYMEDVTMQSMAVLETVRTKPRSWYLQEGKLGLANTDTEGHSSR